MVACIVKGCRHRSGRDKISFFRIPNGNGYKAEKKNLVIRRQVEWLKRIDVKNMTPTKLKHARVCADHFISGKPSSKEDINNPDWAPSLKLGHDKLRFLVGPVSKNDLTNNPDGTPTLRLCLDNTEDTVMPVITKVQRISTYPLRSCIVSNCNNYYRKTSKNNEDVVYHSFPENPYFQQLWLNFCRTEEDLDVTFAKICSVHFTPDSYKRDLEHELLGLPIRRKRFLKEDAVPTLFSPLDAECEPINLKELLGSPDGIEPSSLETSTDSTLQPDVSLQNVVYDDEEWKLLNEKGPKRQKFVDRSTSPGSSVTSAEEATEGELVAPEILCKSKVKVEYDDGSYDDHKGGDKNYSDVIPSAFCEVVINPEKRLQNRNEEVILPEQNINTPARPGENNSSGERIVFGAILPTMSGNQSPCPVTDHTGEFRSVPVIPVNSLGTVADKSLGSAEVTPSTSDEHPLETFFRSMARTVLKFPPHLIAEARMKVCALVSEMEIRALKESYSQKGQLS